ncbi:hypothetical protein CF328_g6840 [Tilletia controversa]|nr:hypothetical protein CF328_g6840 [Tilletia controversa]
MSCDILAALPPELVIEVFAFLDPASLTRCTAICKGWRQLIANDLIWRKVATEQLCLCPATVQVEDLATLPSLMRSYSAGAEDAVLPWTTTTTTMKTTIDRGIFLKSTRSRQSRNSFGSSLLVPEGQLNAWSIKLDPEEGTLIATTMKGGLYVLDVKTNQVLWQLGGGQVDAFEHLEGERGILVISDTREDGEDFEVFGVWAHRRLIPDGGNGDLYRRRSTLRISQRSHASRFRWPVFCAMGESGTAFFWDLSNPEQPRQLMSIDVSSRHGFQEVNYIDLMISIFGTSLGAVMLFDRATGQAKWSMAAHLRQADARSLIRFYKLDLQDVFEDTEHQSPPFELCEQQLLAERHINDELDAAIIQLRDITADEVENHDRNDGRMEWVAIHPDEATGALLVLGQNMLAIIPDFASLSESNCRTPIMMVQYTEWKNRDPISISGMQFALTVADGRAFIVEEYPIVFDLAPQRIAPLTPGSVPFRLPENFEDPPPLRVFAGQNPFFGLADQDGSVGCSCAQMDAANIFAVLPTEAPDYQDVVDETDAREALWEVLHWRIDGA